jgi:hypothetical protein
MGDVLNVVALVKNNTLPSETYLFLFDNESVTQTYDQVQILAEDKDLNLNLRDVVLICKKIREIESRHEPDFE